MALIMAESQLCRGRKNRPTQAGKTIGIRLRSTVSQSYNNINLTPHMRGVKMPLIIPIEWSYIPDNGIHSPFFHQFSSQESRVLFHSLLFLPCDSTPCWFLSCRHHCIGLYKRHTKHLLHTIVTFKEYL